VLRRFAPLGLADRRGMTVTSATEVPRQNVVDLLRKAGMFDEADRAAATLPDPVGVDEAVALLGPHGITKDFLISRLGGSP
jgi:hypothetical protein